MYPSLKYSNHKFGGYRNEHSANAMLLPLLTSGFLWLLASDIWSLILQTFFSCPNRGELFDVYIKYSAPKVSIVLSDKIVLNCIVIYEDGCGNWHFRLFFIFSRKFTSFGADNPIFNGRMWRTLLFKGIKHIVLNFSSLNPFKIQVFRFSQFKFSCFFQIVLRNCDATFWRETTRTLIISCSSFLTIVYYS